MESEEHDRGRRKRPRSLSRGGSGDEDDVPRSTEERGSRKSRIEDGRNYDRIEIIPSRQDSFPSDSGRRSEVGSKQDLARNMIDDERQRPYDENDNTWASQNPAGSFQPSFMNNQGSRGPRPGRGGRMIGSEAQRTGVSLPMINPSFGHPGLPPGSMQQIPNMQLVPPYGPGVLMTPFHGPPQAWPGSQGLEMNMLAMSQGILPIPHGPMGNMYSPMGTGPTSGPMGNMFSPMGTGPTSGPMGNMFSPMGTGQTSGPMGNMFSPMGTGPTPGMYFNQPGPGRGAPLNMSIPGYNSTGPNSHDKAPVGRGPQQRFVPAGRAPTRGEQNDYSQNFVDTGMRPQNFIRELEPTSVVEDYPKLRELIQKKDEIVTNSATLPMYYKCDLREHILTPEFFGTKFDVILVDPPWEEYVHRAPGVTDNMEHWTLEEIQNLQIEAIADTPSFIFLWVGDGVGLEQGRQCLKKWGFRRVEDICWVKTNKTSATPGLRHDSRTLFQHTKEHCLMGMKGTVRRNSDGHIIHANIDTDVMIAEEPEYGSTKKPEDMYRIIEHFALGRRRLELFGEDHNIRSGWLTLGKELSSSNFSAEAYTRNFADQNGKVWQGGGGRNPPPYTPHLVVTTPDIEELRPKSPPPKI